MHFARVYSRVKDGEIKLVSTVQEAYSEHTTKARVSDVQRECYAPLPSGRTGAAFHPVNVKWVETVRLLWYSR